MKVLITGASWLLGIKVVKELQRKGYEVIPTHYSNPLHRNSVKLDITRKLAVNNLITKIKPEIVIHRMVLNEKLYLQMGRCRSYLC